MSRTPRVTGPELIGALTKAGFSILRVKGSHHFLRYWDGRSTVVPAHSGETIGPGLLHKILWDCQITAGRLSELLYGRSLPINALVTAGDSVSECHDRRSCEADFIGYYRIAEAPPTDNSTPIHEARFV